MAEPMTIAVAGATGAQGGGLVRAILNDPERRFRARALTRDVASPKARAVAEAGADVVAADVDDPASIERAFAGAHGAFCVTFFWDHMSPEREGAQAAALARGAKAAGVRHAIWSTLEDTRTLVPLDDPRMPTLQGKWKVPHFDAKGETDQLFTTLGVPTTFLLTSFYWDNFIYFGSGPKRGPDGTLALIMPMADAKLPGIAAEDIGRCAFGIFQRGEELIGRRVGIAGEHLSGAEMAAKLTRALAQPVSYNDVPADVYRSFGFPGADDIGNMFQFNRDFTREFRTPRDVAFARSLNPALQDFDAWLAANKDKIPLD